MYNKMSQRLIYFVNGLIIKTVNVQSTLLIYMNFQNIRNFILHISGKFDITLHYFQKIRTKKLDIFKKMKKLHILYSKNKNKMKYFQKMGSYFQKIGKIKKLFSKNLQKNHKYFQKIGRDEIIFFKNEQEKVE